jgi:predicted RNA-binding Zn-ribbon protein involved in translation (DUF1610 family)
MARWMKPTEEMPKVEAGDRVLIIVRERLRVGSPLFNRLVTLVATEDGWEALEDAYYGYTPHDGVLWTTEKDLCQIGTVLAEDGQGRVHGCHDCGEERIPRVVMGVLACPDCGSHNLALL